MKNHHILIIIQTTMCIPLFIILVFTIVCGCCDKTDPELIESYPIRQYDENSQCKSALRSLHEEAILMITAGRYKEAENRLKQIITSHPEFLGTYRSLGEILSRYISNIDSISEFLNKQLMMNPENGYVYWSLGLLSAEQKEYDNACHYFKQALLYKPGFYDAFESLVDIYKIQGKIQEAVPSLVMYFHDLQKEGSDKAEYGLAYLYFNLGKMEDSFTICERLCTKPLSQSAGRLLKLTGTLYSIKRHSLIAFNYYQCALKAFRACGDKQGETAALINLGITSDQLLKYEKALEKYQQALPLAKLLQNYTYDMTFG